MNLLCKKGICKLLSVHKIVTVLNILDYYCCTEEQDLSPGCTARVQFPTGAEMSLPPYQNQLCAIQSGPQLGIKSTFLGNEVAEE
jgi:hypothetical protein